VIAHPFVRQDDAVRDHLAVRPATPADAAAIQAIYAPVVEQTVISFEAVPPTVPEIAARIRATTEHLPWLVAAIGDEVVGYAYASHHSDRAAYRWSVDVSLYIAEVWRGQNVGTALYLALFAELRVLGFVSAYAGITMPNVASVAVHEKLGFGHIGRFPNAGFKHGSWHDVGWWHLALQPPPDNPEEPTRWQP
jgi:phosphinothricin acetyltransferase